MASIECTKCGATLKKIADDDHVDPVPSLVAAWNKRVVGGEFDGGYRYLSKSSQSQIEKVIVEMFPGYKVSFMEDPDCKSTILVRLYDVNNDDITEYKQILEGICYHFEEVLHHYVDLIPSIVNSADTEKYYPEYKRDNRHGM